MQRAMPSRIGVSVFLVIGALIALATLARAVLNATEVQDMLLAAGDRIRVLPLGDSITSCTGMKRDFSFAYHSYRRPLWEMLRHGGFDSCVAFVGTRKGCNKRLDSNLANITASFPPYHDSHYGRTAAAVAPLAQELYQQLKPRVVLLMLGINDLFADPDGIQDALSSLRAIVTGFESPSRESAAATHVFIATLPQLSPRRAKAGKEFVRRVERSVYPFNSRLRRAFSGSPVAGSGVSVVVVDVAEGYDPAAMTYDGVHPNVAGERHVAAAWYAALERVLPTLGCGAGGGVVPKPKPTPTPVPSEVAPAATPRTGLPDVEAVEPKAGLVQPPADMGATTFPLGIGIVVLVAAASAVLVVRRKRRTSS